MLILRKSPAVTAGLGFLLFDDLSIGGVLLDGLDAVDAGTLGVVDLGGGDDLAVGVLQVELDAGGDGADDEFAHNITFLSPQCG